MDAICIVLEHENGDAIVSFFPYEKDQFGQIAYGEVFSVKGEHNFFGGEGPA